MWKLLKYSSSDPFGDKSSHSIDYLIDSTTSSVTELVEVERLEKMFKIPALDVVIKDESLRSIALNWLNHFRMDKEVDGNGSVLHVNPAVPFRLMHLPYVYHDLLQRSAFLYVLSFFYFFLIIHFYLLKSNLDAFCVHSQIYKTMLPGL